MKKLHVKTKTSWLPVFGYNGATGVLITCECAPEKALPSVALHGPADLQYFQSHYANQDFCLMEPVK